MRGSCQLVDSKTIRWPGTHNCAKTKYREAAQSRRDTIAVSQIHVDAQHIMVPNQAPPTSTTITGPLPPLTRSTTLPPATTRSVATDRSLLTPEDAIYQGSPPRKQSAAVQKLQKDLRMTNGVNGDAARPTRRGRHKDRNRSGSRRRKGTWRKLLWVKQSCEQTIRDWRAVSDENRPGQLHRPRHLSRRTPAQSSPPALRFLAPCCRLNRHSTARLLGHNLYRMFRQHIPKVCLSRCSGRLG